MADKALREIARRTHKMDRAYRPATDTELLGWVDEIQQIPPHLMDSTFLRFPCKSVFRLPGKTFACELNRHYASVQHSVSGMRPGGGEWALRWSD